MSELDTIKAFGDKLHGVRAENGLSASEMGRRCGVHGATVSNWEAGRCKPSREAYNGLIHAFPAAQDDGIEGIISVTNKPGGCATKNNGGRPKGIKGAPPAHPQVRSKSKKKAEKEDEFMTLRISGKMLSRLAVALASDAESRAELINALRRSGTPDAMILDLIHGALP